jgi:Glycosyltransferase family 28 C-terminal domain
VQMPPTGPPYVTLPYLDRMDLAYAAADFAICRSGAMTCAELTAVGLPAVYVPLPHGNGEQRLNALPVAAAGGGLIVADAELTPEWIRADLLPILTDAQLVAAMSQAAAGIGHRDTDVRLAAEVLGLIRGGPGGTDRAEPGRSPGQGRGQRGARRRPRGDGRRPHDDGRRPHDDGRRPHDDGRRPHDDGRRPHDDGRGRHGGGQAPPGRYDDPGWPGSGGYEQPGQYGDPRPAGPGYEEEPGWYQDPRPAAPGYEEPGWYQDPRPAGPGYDQAGPYPDPRQPGR